MPQVENPTKYKAILSSAQKILSKSALPIGLFRTFEQGTALYRYSSYMNYQPQQEADVRKIWTPLANDLDNRWSGVGPDNAGFSALYLSLDGEGPEDTCFPELAHYQKVGMPPDTEISYFKYKAGEAPQPQKAKASELRSMFLFTSMVDLAGIDLRYANPSAMDIMKEILANAKANAPGAFSSTDTVDSLYFDPKDASFCRAVGNAALSNSNFIITTSVRDSKSENVALKGSSGEMISCLKPQGRASFYLAGGKKPSLAVVTKEDMLYNDKIGKAT